MTSYQVRFWDIRKIADTARGRYRVRWAVDGRERCKSFATKALADAFLVTLKDGARDGTPFDPATGLPAPPKPAARPAVTWYELLNDTGYGEVWQRARPTALTAAQQASPLARRPYDLRHAAVSLWLNAGVPATEVARRAGHGVAVLLKVYANCIDGQAGAANQRISDALDDPDGE
jgi:integrase